MEEDLGQLRGLFGRYLPKGVLRPTKSGTNSRRRVFSTEVTFWLFLFQVLCRGCACREVVRKMQAWRRDRRTRKTDSAAYCMARERLPMATLQSIFSTLAATLERRVCDAERWLGERRVKILDGTGISMPDTLKNQARWPQHGEQKPGCGFPLIRMVGLFCMGSGAMLRYAFGDKHQQENHLARAVLDGLEKGDVLLADRGFCSYALMASLSARGVDSVLRLHQMRNHALQQGKRLGPRDRLVEWTRPRENRRNDPWATERPALPETFPVRLVDFCVEEPGFRTRKVTLATTLLDPEEYPAEVLAELYRARWGIELRFREIKTTLGAEILRCQSPAMIEKELCLHAIAYNLLRSIMQESAQRHHLDLGRISFKGTADSVRHFADALHAASGNPRTQRQLYDQMLHHIAQDTLPWRPNRTEPRARKRRPKPYQLLNQPRHQMRPIPHKNSYTAPAQEGLI